MTDKIYAKIAADLEKLAAHFRELAEGAVVSEKPAKAQSAEKTPSRAHKEQKGVKVPRAAAKAQVEEEEEKEAPRPLTIKSVVKHLEEYGVEVPLEQATAAFKGLKVDGRTKRKVFNFVSKYFGEECAAALDEAGGMAYLMVAIILDDIEDTKDTVLKSIVEEVQGIVAEHEEESSEQDDEESDEENEGDDEEVDEESSDEEDEDWDA